MGGKSSKSSLSVEDLAFLVTNTNLSTDEIQVRYDRTAVWWKIQKFLLGLAPGIHQGLSKRRIFQRSVCLYVQQNVSGRKSNSFQ